MKFLVFIVGLSLLLAGQVGAQESEQIRIEDVCRVSSERLKALTDTPLYAKAIAAKKQGHLLPMQAERLRRADIYRSMYSGAKCGKKK